MWGKVATSPEETAARLAYLEMEFIALRRYVDRLAGRMMGVAEYRADDIRPGMYGGEL